jgi:hypothetical protein
MTYFDNDLICKNKLDIIKTKKWGNMKIEMMAVKLLKPYEKNPRLNTKAIPQVMKSLAEFGWRQPIVVDKDLVVIVGHTRLAAAKKLKLKQVPVHVADLTEAQVSAYRITDNRSHDRSEWDIPLLGAELDAVFEMDFKYDLDFMDFAAEDLKPEKEEKAPDDQPYKSMFEVVVECFDEGEQQSAYENLTAQGFKCRVLSM